MRNVAGTLIVMGRLALAVAVPTSASAQGHAEKGRVSFVLNCAVCHGMDGGGKGPLADVLKVAPADLTLLTARHDGQFPSAKISDVIRNGSAVLGHGTTEMPAWGEYFAIKGQPEVARSRIADLVRYLESIQAKMSPVPAP